MLPQTILDATTHLLPNDSILSAYLQTENLEERKLRLEALIVDHARPIAAKILARYRTQLPSREDLEDLVSAVDLRVIRRLHQLAENPSDPIERLDDYVATVTYNAVYDLLRKRYPERARLKNRPLKSD